MHIKYQYMYKECENMINIQDAPFKAVGDGKTDDTRAIQKAIDVAGTGGRVYIPSGSYRITDTLNIGFYPGLFIGGESWESSALIMDADNKPIFRFSIQDTHSITMEEMTLRFTRQQTNKMPNGTAVEYTNATSNENGLYHHIYRKLKVQRANYGFNITSSGQLPVWGCKWEDILLSSTATSCFKIRAGKPVGKPMNIFSNIKIFQDTTLTPSYAFDLQTEFLLDALDIEVWKNEILINDSGFNCVIRYVHVEHHIITKDYCTLFILQDGSYTVSAIDVSIRSWTNSLHTLLQGNKGSVLNATNVRVNPESGIVNGTMAIIGTFGKVVAAALMKSNLSTYVVDYAVYLNNVWNIYSLDGLPPYIENGYALPTANEAYRGRMFYKRTTNGSDILYLCSKGTDNKYAWRKVSLV
jgi:hypothetical protein